jgi:hypothetical protein
MSLDLQMPAFMGSKRREPLPTGGGRKQPRTQKGGNGSSSGAGGLEAIVLATAELSLEAKQDAKEVLGFSQYAVLAPATSELVVESLAEGKVFSELTQTKKGEDVGPGHVRIFLKGMAGTTKMKDFMDDPEYKKALEDFWNQKVSLSPLELKEQIHIYRALKPKISKEMDLDAVYGEEGYARLLIRLRPSSKTDSVAETLQENFLRVCKKLGWTIYFGTAPKSAKERKLLEAIKDFKRY